MIPEPITNAQIRPAVVARRMSRITSPAIGMVPWGAAARAALTAQERKDAPHAGPGDSFPVPNLKHARLAVQMASHAGSGKSKIIAKVHRLYPSVEIGGK